MKKTRAKEFKVYHLQHLFWGVFVRGFLSWGFLSGGLLSRGFCPDTSTVT